MKLYFVLVLLALSVLAAAGCQAPPAPASVNVFAAASLTAAFEEIGQGFAAAHPGAQVAYNFAGTNQLAAQIGEGAPADVFAAANAAQMEAAIASGRVAPGTQETFVRNRLVVVTPRDNPAGLSTLQDLGRTGVKIVLAAAEVPIGQYALAFLDKAAADPGFGTGYKEAVLANVVSYEENVRSVLAKVTLGEADAGIVYASDAAMSGDAVQAIAIPDALNLVANYPIAVLRDSPNAPLAAKFVEYVLGAEGQAVLAKYGFSTVEND